MFSPKMLISHLIIGARLRITMYLTIHFNIQLLRWTIKIQNAAP